jgi:hypothetical protein
MRVRMLSLSAGVAVTIAFSIAPVSGQSPAGRISTDGGTVPRTPWGDPDLQGIWPGTAMMGVPIERPLAPGAPRGGGPGGGGAGLGPPGHWGERGEPQTQTSLVIDPPDGRIPPMTAEGQRRTAAIPKTWYYDNNGGGPFGAPADLSAYDRCITRGVVGSMLPVGYNAGNEIVQAPGYVALRNEMIHETRIIPLDPSTVPEPQGRPEQGRGTTSSGSPRPQSTGEGRRPRLSSQFRFYMGDSRGRWDGDTLVVETTNLTAMTGVGANGRALFHSDQLRLVERFTRIDADTIRYELTIDDPVMWTRPWTMAFPLKREPDYGMFEYACHEGNYGLRNILSGSRADEAAGAR